MRASAQIRIRGYVLVRISVETQRRIGGCVGLDESGFEDAWVCGVGSQDIRASRLRRRAVVLAHRAPCGVSPLRAFIADASGPSLHFGPARCACPSICARGPSHESVDGRRRTEAPPRHTRDPRHQYGGNRQYRGVHNARGQQWASSRGDDHHGNLGEQDDGAPCPGASGEQQAQHRRQGQCSGIDDRPETTGVLGLGSAQCGRHDAPEGQTGDQRDQCRAPCAFHG